jgi:hypothetical protein
MANLRLYAGTRAAIALLAIAFAICTSATSSRAEESLHGSQEFLSRIEEVPFCFLPNATRSWQILRHPLAETDEVHLTVANGGQVLASGPEIDFSSLHVEVTPAGKLQIRAEDCTEATSFKLAVKIQRRGALELLQSLDIRQAPPSRPISYIADLCDDLIHTFVIPTNGSFRKLDRDGFDQYFRRLQAQGITRLIVWAGPFSYFTDPSDHDPEDWKLYEAQARAVVRGFESKFEGVPEPTTLDAQLSLPQGKLANYTWIARLLLARLEPQLAKDFTDSAKDHGIALTASFRPFEIAVSKFYEIPAFDESGKFLWNFLPMAVPRANYHADEVAFAHYRTILRAAGREDAAELASVELNTNGNGEEIARAFTSGNSPLLIEASKCLPVDPNSYVLAKNEAGQFCLQQYRKIADRASKQRIVLKDIRVEALDSDTIRISNLSVPSDYRYLVIRNPAESEVALTSSKVSMKSKAGTSLGRANWYWALSDKVDSTHSTLVAGITEDGEYRTVFNATENSIGLLSGSPPAVKFSQASLVIDLGAPWNYEMLDYEQPAARKLAITQLKRLLSYPAYDEIFINTRTHTQLSGCMGDGADGIRPQREYIANDERYFHLGVDRAYAPRSLAENPLVQELAVDQEGIDRITEWQAGEWQGPCESDDSPYPWRLERKRATANGIRMLLQDIEREFPGRRVRVVVPPTDSTVEAVRTDLARLPKDSSGAYGSDYYGHIWSSINHIPAVGESLSITDFSGLSVEPVFLGIRFTPDKAPLQCYLEHVFVDMAKNRGSNFHGPRSFFYEAQETLRGTAEDLARLRKQREEIICELLSHPDEVNEVLLYEAVDWAYGLPMSDPDLCGHNFLDRRANVTVTETEAANEDKDIR